MSEDALPKDVVVSIPKSEGDFALALEAERTLEATRLIGAGIDGGGEFLVLLIPLATVTVNKLVELLKAYWEKTKNVKFEIDGMTITGASLGEISEFLERNVSKDKALSKPHRE